MELRKRQFRWYEQFHGIPWNSMELGVRQFRWHEQFHGIPWNSMELEVRLFRWHEKFHGIPWNLKCANFAHTRSSMEFHGIPWNLECANFAHTGSSMEFHIYMKQHMVVQSSQAHSHGKIWAYYMNCNYSTHLIKVLTYQRFHNASASDVWPFYEIEARTVGVCSAASAGGYVASCEKVYRLAQIRNVNTDITWAI